MQIMTRGRRFGMTVWIITAGATVVVPGPAVRGDEPAVELQFELLQRAVGQGMRALADPANARRAGAEAAAAEQVQDAQRRQQIRQIEQMLQPLVHTELEMVRQACGDLEPRARREIRMAAEEAKKRVAGEWVGRQGKPGGSLDARSRLHALIATAVEAHATPGQHAAYAAEERARQSRREEAARLRIIAKLDESLDLSDDQRVAILDDLRGRWQASWIRELQDQGVFLHNQRLAPDYAAGCITPHLSAEQQAAWQNWIRVAGGRQVNLGGGMRFEGHGLQKGDEWWTQ
jgi:hypothetical protein